MFQAEDVHGQRHQGGRIGSLIPAIIRRSVWLGHNEVMPHGWGNRRPREECHAEELGHYAKAYRHSSTACKRHECSQQFWAREPKGGSNPDVHRQINA